MEESKETISEKNRIIRTLTLTTALTCVLAASGCRSLQESEYYGSDTDIGPARAHHHHHQPAYNQPIRERATREEPRNYKRARTR